MKKMNYLGLITFITWLLISSNLYADQLYKVNSYELNVRKAPNQESEKIGKLYLNDKVTLIEVTNTDWYLIEFESEGLKGYASSKYLSAIENPVSETTEATTDEESTFGTIFQSLRKIDSSTFWTLLIVGVLIIGLLYAPFAGKKRESTEKENINNNEKSNIGNNNNNTQPNVIIIRSTKNVGIAIFLAMMFPYFGVLYATVSGFLWLFFSYIGMWAFLLYWGFKTSSDGVLYIGFVLSMLHWLISIIWAGVSANNYNKRIKSGL